MIILFGGGEWRRKCTMCEDEDSQLWTAVPMECH